MAPNKKICLNALITEHRGLFPRRAKDLHWCGRPIILALYPRKCIAGRAQVQRSNVRHAMRCANDLNLAPEVIRSGMIPALCRRNKSRENEDSNEKLYFH
jgi:hypothetical protein